MTTLLLNDNDERQITSVGLHAHFEYQLNPNEAPFHT